MCARIGELKAQKLYQKCSVLNKRRCSSVLQGNWGFASLSSSVPIFLSGSKTAVCPAQVLQQHQPLSRALQQLLLFSDWTANSQIQNKRKSFSVKSKHLVGKTLNSKNKRIKYFPSLKKFSATPPKAIPNCCTRTQGSSMWDMQTMGRLVKKNVWAAECFLLHMPAAGSQCCRCSWWWLEHQLIWKPLVRAVPEGKALKVQPTP